MDILNLNADLQWTRIEIKKMPLLTNVSRQCECEYRLLQYAKILRIQRKGIVNILHINELHFVVNLWCWLSEKLV